MPFIDAIRLALAQIRVQKLKSFFTLLGVTIGVMFLIAVVSIVEGMGSYMEHDFVGKLFGVNTFSSRRIPSSGGDVSEAEWREMAAPAAHPDHRRRAGRRGASAGHAVVGEGYDNVAMHRRARKPRTLEA